MNTMKCSSCGLISYAGEVECLRCGKVFVASRRSTAGGKRHISREFLYTLLAIALIGGAADYFYIGLSNSMNEVNLNEAKRVGAQAQPAPGLNRASVDQKRVEPYKKGIQNSSGIAASQRHNAETERLIQASTTSQTP